MRVSQLEAWAIDVVDRAIRRAPVEDDRVELKAGWIDPAKAARRVAAHANSLGGDEVLWIIGVDEKAAAVVPFPAVDLAKWLAAMEAEFEGVAPILQTLAVPTADGPVMALLFDATRVPFVVRNREGGQVQYEVPWRSGTGTRTARRSELLQVLGPQAAMPYVEVLEARAGLDVPPKPDRSSGDVRVILYVSWTGRERLVLPRHKCSGLLRLGDSEHRIRGLHPARLGGEGGHVVITDSEAILTGPGSIELAGRLAPGAHFGDPFPPVAEVILDLGFIGLRSAAVVVLNLAAQHRQPGRRQEYLAPSGND